MAPMSANTAIRVRASPNTTEHRNANLMPSTRLAQRLTAGGNCLDGSQSGC